MRLLILVVVASCLACSQNKNLKAEEVVAEQVEVSDASTLKAVTEDKVMEEKLMDNECYQDREDTHSITDEICTVQLVIGQYMLSAENKRWHPCSLPESFQKEGMQVKVSGTCKKIKPNERRAGTPFVITSITSAEK